MYFRLLLIFFLFGSAAASAQSFHAAVKGGITATQVSGDNLAGFDQLGGVLGGVVGIPISGKVDLNLEILFAQKGSRKKAYPDKGDYTEYLLRLNYIEIPLLLQYKHSKRFALEAGPAIGVLVSYKEENELGPFVWSEPRPFDKLELSAAVGMLYNLTENWSIVSRFETSMLPIRPHLSGQTYQLNLGQYNTVLMFALQYRFNNKSKVE
jgi:hypothetical protein